MGRPNPVLEIAVVAHWLEQGAVKWLIETGHRVFPYPGSINPDLILHPAAGWHESLFEVRVRQDDTVRFPYLEMALVRARKYRRERKL